MSTTDGEQATTWLSQEAYDRLQGELDQLIANRPAIAAEINARREEGDLRENGGYHAAREEQAKAKEAEKEREKFRAERDAAILRSLEALETINDKPTAAFWKEVDARPGAQTP